MLEPLNPHVEKRKSRFARGATTVAPLTLSLRPRMWMKSRCNRSAIRPCSAASAFVLHSPFQLLTPRARSCAVADPRERLAAGLLEQLAGIGIELEQHRLPLDPSVVVFQEARRCLVLAQPRQREVELERGAVFAFDRHGQWQFARRQCLGQGDLVVQLDEPQVAIVELHAGDRIRVGSLRVAIGLEVGVRTHVGCATQAEVCQRHEPNHRVLACHAIASRPRFLRRPMGDSAAAHSEEVRLDSQGPGWGTLVDGFVAVGAGAGTGVRLLPVRHCRAFWV